VSHTSVLGEYGLSSSLSVRSEVTESALQSYRLFDVYKQIVGQMFVHGVNVLISDLGSHHTSGNACTYYFLNVLVDTTLGEYRPIYFTPTLTLLFPQVLL